MLIYDLIYETEYKRSSRVFSSYAILIRLSPDENRIIRDICCDEDKLRRLIDLMNELELDPVHADQVIEEFLTDPARFFL